MLSVLVDPALTRFGIPTPTGMVAVWLAASAPNWVAGTRLNARPDREPVDPRTGQAVILRARHTLFWIPIQYLSVLLLGVVAALGTFFAKVPGHPV